MLYWRWKKWRVPPYPGALTEWPYLAILDFDAIDLAVALARRERAKAKRQQQRMELLERKMEIG